MGATAPERPIGRALQRRIWNEIWQVRLIKNGIPNGVPAKRQ